MLLLHSLLTSGFPVFVFFVFKQENDGTWAQLKELNHELVQSRRKVCTRMASVFQFEKVSDLKVRIFNLPFLTSGILEGQSNLSPTTLLAFLFSFFHNGVVLQAFPTTY